MEKLKLETRRNLFHLIMGLLVVVLIHADLLNLQIIIPGVVAGFFVSFLSRKYNIPIIGWLLSKLERKEDLERLPGHGALFFFVGTILALALFPKDIALAAVTILAVGDSVTALTGMRSGRIKHPLSDKKFLEGSIAGFIFASLGAAFFVLPLEALIASFFSMMVEAVDSIKGSKIEDNITIPLVAGLAITVLRML